jgi:hypothetical protein
MRGGSRLCWISEAGLVSLRAGRVEDVGVDVGQRQRSRGLPREAHQRRFGRVDRQERSEGPSTQQQRGRDGARPLLLEVLSQPREPLARNLGTDRKGDVELARELLRAGQSQQQPALDVHQVQGHRRHAGQPPRLGDDLLAKQVPRDLVEHVGHVQRRGAARQLSGWAQHIGLVGIGGLLHALAHHADQILA